MEKWSRRNVFVGLAALSAVVCLSALFEASPLKEPLRAQLHALSYLRAGRVGKMIEARPSEWAKYLPEEPSSPQPAVHADHARGFYDRPFKLILEGAPDAAVYYTADGSVPSSRGIRYQEPIGIDHTTILTFAAVDPNHPASAETHTFLIAETDAVPIVSLTLHPTLLWNRHAGIYVNPYERGRGWRRPAQAEFFEDKNSAPQHFPVSIKIHGNWSRGAEKKSFDVSYQNVQSASQQRTRVLRALGVESSYRLGDELFRSVYADAGGLVPSGRRVRLILNGVKWGVYNLYDKIDRAYLQRTLGPGEYDLVDDAAYFASPEGQAWNQLLDFFVQHDLSRANDFIKATELIDVENFTDYWLFNVYTGNYDWPHNNYYAFRKHSGDNRWRWLSWDTDVAFDSDTGLRHDTLAWATRKGLRHDLSYGGTTPDDESSLPSTIIIRGLLQNAGYQARFVRRFCELRDSYFRPDLLQARFQRIVDEITPLLKDDWERWPGSKAAYQHGVDGVRRFINERPGIAMQHFRAQLGTVDCSAV